MLKTFLILPALLFCAIVSAQFASTHVDIVPYEYSTDRDNTYAVDLNNDSLPELVTFLNELSTDINHHSLVWYKNTGAGRFSGEAHLINNIGYGEVLFADLDLDGYTDIFVYGDDINPVVWYKNTGTGEFISQGVIPNIEWGNSGLRLADMDGDSDTDIVSGSYWYENFSDGTFGTHVIGNSVEALEVKDVDGDGDQDVITYNLNYVLIWYANPGTGNFGPEQIVSGESILPISDAYRHILAVDTDNDGDMDLVRTFANTVYFYENISGDFDNSQIIATALGTIKDLDACDVDADGNIDLIVTTAYFPYLESRATLYYRNGGSNGFDVSRLVTDVPLNGSKLSVHDLNSDGLSDILTSGGRCINAGGGNFKPLSPTHLMDNGWVQKIIHYDLDNDGYLDIIWPDHYVLSWSRNNGENLYELPESIIQYNALSSVEIGDFDSDGDGDILTTSSLPDQQIMLYKNEANATHWTEQLLTTDQEPIRRTVCEDMESDGDIDILVVSGDYSILLFSNTGNGTFDGGQQIIYDDSHGLIQNIIAGNLDGDDHLDIVLSYGDVVYSYMNTGGTTFPDAFLGQSTFIMPICLIDCDQDGDQDYVSLLGSQIVWRANDGTGTFLENHLLPLTQPTNYLTRGMVSSDLDQDGDQDIVLYNNEMISWFENKGYGNFGDHAILYREAYLALHHATASDMDGDSDLDLLYSASGHIGWVENIYLTYANVSGHAFVDANQNGVRDSGDLSFPLTQINTDPINEFILSNADGGYRVFFPPMDGDYIISPTPVPHWNITTDSSLYHIHLDTSFLSVDNLDFGFYPDTLIHVLQAELIGGFPRCNTVVNYWLNFQNTGTTIPSGIIHLELDSGLAYLSSELMPDSISGQHLYWHYDSLLYFDYTQLEIAVQMPDFNSMGDTLTSYLHVAVDGDINIAFADTLNQVLVCAYDPNDKTVTPAGVEAPGYIAMESDWLEYTIRFQNTGNDTALVVVIRDQLDSALDWHSIQPLAQSHLVEIQGDQEGMLTFTFQDIYLPDSTVNELASHGFIRYKVRLRENLPAGTSIENTAFIYFDQNPAVVTNSTRNTLYACPEALEISMSQPVLCLGSTLSATIMPQPLPANYSWDLGLFEQQTGADFMWTADSTGSFDLFVHSTDALCSQSMSLPIVVEDCLGLDEVVASNFVVYPNPFSETTRVSFQQELNRESDLLIYTLQGGIIYYEPGLSGKTHVINTAISPGVYLICLVNRTTGEQVVKRLVKN